MTKDQYDTLVSVCGVLDIIAYAGNMSSGLSYNMGEACKILSALLLQIIEDDANRNKEKQ